jgi:hypothetical protein
MVGSYSLLNAISVIMEQWTIEHRVFVFETFIQTGSSVVLTQRRFRTHFNVGRHGAKQRFTGTNHALFHFLCFKELWTTSPLVCNNAWTIMAAICIMLFSEKVI